VFDHTEIILQLGLSHAELHISDKEKRINPFRVPVNSVEMVKHDQSKADFEGGDLHLNCNLEASGRREFSKDKKEVIMYLQIRDLDHKCLPGTIQGEFPIAPFVYAGKDMVSGIRQLPEKKRDWDNFDWLNEDV